MRVLRASDPHEVIAAFLLAEIDSGRWGESIRALLMRDRRSESIVRLPDLESAEDNEYRRALLREFRGWPDRLLFTGFPSDVSWSRVQLDRADLRAIRYINYSYWVALSGNTRRPSDAARRIASGLAEEHRRAYEAIADRIRSGGVLPEMILVADRVGGQLVTLEGNARITGYVIAGVQAPDVLGAFLGVSAWMGRWGLY